MVSKWWPVRSRHDPSPGPFFVVPEASPWQIMLPRINWLLPILRHHQSASQICCVIDCLTKWRNKKDKLKSLATKLIILLKLSKYYILIPVNVNNFNFNFNTIGRSVTRTTFCVSGITITIIIFSVSIKSPKKSLQWNILWSHKSTSKLSSPKQIAVKGLGS